MAINQSYSFHGVPSRFDPDNNQWRLIFNQSDFKVSLIQPVVPATILLRFQERQLVAKITLTSASRCEQQTQNSVVIHTTQGIYGIQFSSQEESHYFVFIVQGMIQKLCHQVEQPISADFVYYQVPHTSNIYSPGEYSNQMSKAVFPEQQEKEITAEMLLSQHLYRSQIPQEQKQVQQEAFQYTFPQQNIMPKQNRTSPFNQGIVQSEAGSKKVINQAVMQYENFGKPNYLLDSGVDVSYEDSPQRSKALAEQDINKDDHHSIPTEEELACDLLSEAIENGNIQQAQEAAVELAKMNSKLTVQLLPHSGPIEKKTDFNILIKIEDKYENYHGAPILVNVDPLVTTIRMLKIKIRDKYQFPVSTQRFIINDRLAKDNETLCKCGVKTTGTEIYLYLISHNNSTTAEVATQTEQIFYDQRNNVENGLNFIGNMHNSNRTGEYPSYYQVPQSPVSPRQVLHSGEVNIGLTLEPQLNQSPHRLPAALLERSIPGWECLQCTYKNPPTYPGCKMCMANRPEDYEIPVNYNLTQEEKDRMQQEQYLDHLALQGEFQRKRLEADKAKANYQQTLARLQKKLLPNTYPIDCPICYTNFEAGQAVMLRECLHCFCKDCLVECIKASLDPEVQCPHNEQFACPAVITGQEIEELLSKEEFAAFLDRSLATAENRVENSFHCQTPNCKGWCVYEDDVNQFDCPVCLQRNCLTCKAIHLNKTCKEYQEELKIKAENDDAAKKTQDMLQELINTGEAMNCPKCKIILQKKSGCDWMRCTMCLTEICWATKGPRWGPAGTGDTSGGCKCRIGGKPCTPKCGNCH